MGNAVAGDGGIDRISLRVTIKHADVDEAAFPVLVGHMRALPIEGALADLDELMSGRLVERQRSGHFPDKGGAVYFRAPGRQPPGVVVIDLGETGGLTRKRLVKAVAAGVTTVADVARHGVDPSLADPQSDPVPPGLVGLSSVLVGCGSLNGLSEAASLTSIIEGVLRALDRSSAEALGRAAGRPAIVELEIIEVNSDAASDALTALHALNPDDFHIGRCVLDKMSTGTRLERGRGGLRGARPSDAHSQPWGAVFVREVAESAPAVTAAPPAISASGRFVRGRLRPKGLRLDNGPSSPTRPTRCDVTFTALGRAAQLDEIRHRIDLTALRHLLELDVADADGVEGDRRRSSYLRSLLIPDAAVEMLEDADNLLLLVDSVTARFPWEVALADASIDGQLRGRGLLRQFVGHVKQGVRRPVRDATAFVAGGWIAGTPEIKQTGDEVDRVVCALESARYAVAEPIKLIGEYSSDPGRRILESLATTPYRIVHLALHGQLDGTGLMVGPHQVFDADAVTRMASVPDLVFLNCCYSGAIAETGADLARALFAKGVRAVVAAAWKIDDALARDFAVKFYEVALGGRPFGEAVWQARNAVLSARKDPQAWGAFQCYGDPGFMLTDSRPTRIRTVVTEEDLLRRLTNVQRRATRLGSEAELATELDHMYGVHVDVPRFPVWRAEPPTPSTGGDEPDPSDCLDAEEVGALSAFGDAYQALGPLGYRRAISCFRNAVTAAQLQARPELRFHTVEELAYTEGLSADVTVRLKWDAHPPPVDPAEAAILLDSDPLKLLGLAQGRLEQLVGIHDAPASHAYLGAVLKRRALVCELTGEGDADVALSMAIGAYTKAERKHCGGRSRGVDGDAPSTFEIYYLTNKIELTAVRALRLPGWPRRIELADRLRRADAGPGTDGGVAPGLWDWARAHELAVAALVVNLANGVEPSDDDLAAVADAYGSEARRHRVTPFELAVVAANLSLLADLARGYAGEILRTVCDSLPSLAAIAGPPLSESEAE